MAEFEFEPSSNGVKTYRMTLEVEIVVPQHRSDPVLTLTPEEVRESLLQTGKRGNGYPVCAPDTSDRDGRLSNKLTAGMHIMSARFDACPTCGTPKPSDGV